MLRQSKSQSAIKKVLYSKAFLIISIILLIVLIIFLGRAIKRKYEITQEVKRFEEEKDQLESENKRLSELLDYLKTDSYRDKVSREQLGLQKEGETVLSFPESEQIVKDSGKEGNGAELIIEKTNYQKWWDYFFGG